MKIFLVLMLIATVSHATPAPGEYSNMEKGTLISIKEGVPSCLASIPDEDETKALRRDQLFNEFRTVHIRVTPKTLELVVPASPPNLPTAAVDVRRTATLVSGFIDIKVPGAPRELIAVRDPSDTMHETMVVGFVTVDKDGKPVCGDAISGIAMREPLPTAPVKSKK